MALAAIHIDNHDHHKDDDHHSVDHDHVSDDDYDDNAG